MEGQAGHLALHPCTGLLVHHCHNRGYMRHCPSCSFTCRSNCSVKKLEYCNQLFTRRESEVQIAQCHISANSQHFTSLPHPGLACCPHTRRKHTMPAGVADRKMYSWKLGNTEKFKKCLLSTAESFFRADQRCKCTARLLAGIPCAAEASHSFR